MIIKNFILLNEKFENNANEISRDDDNIKEGNTANLKVKISQNLSVAFSKKDQGMKVKMKTCGIVTDSFFKIFEYEGEYYFEYDNNGILIESDANKDATREFMNKIYNTNIKLRIEKYLDESGVEGVSLPESITK